MQILDTRPTFQTSGDSKAIAVLDIEASSPNVEHAIILEVGVVRLSIPSGGIDTLYDSVIRDADFSSLNSP